MRTLLVVSLLGLAVGCKDKPKRKAPPTNPSKPTATPGGSPGQPAPDLELPHSEGGPPKKTTAPHTKADYEKLSKLTFPGFDATVRTVGDKVFEVRQATNGHPRLWATVTIQHCLDCVPMELEKWKSKTEDLKVLLGPQLRKSPSVTFEVGGTHLNGQLVMYSYQFGASGTADGDDKITLTAEPNATYQVIDRQGDRMKPAVTVKRTEGDATAFTIREADCAKKQWRTISSTTVIEELVKNIKTDVAYEPVADADKNALFMQVCKPSGGAGLNQAFTNAFAVYFNDGINQIRVVAEYKDDPVALGELKRRAPKSDLQALALSFLDVYSHAW